MASWNAVVYGAYFGLAMAVSLLMEPVWKSMDVVLGSGEHTITVGNLSIDVVVE